MNTFPDTYHPLIISPVGSLVLIRHITEVEYGYVTEITPTTVTVELERTPTKSGNLYVLILKEWYLTIPQRSPPYLYMPSFGEAVAVFIQRALLH